MKFCPYCGSPVTDGDKCCGHCGCNLEAEDALDAADFSDFADAPTVRVSRVPEAVPSADAPAAPGPIRPKDADRSVPPAGPRLMGSMGNLSFGGVSAPVPASAGAEGPVHEELHPAEFESGEPEPLPPAVEEAVPEAPEPAEPEPLWPEAEKTIPETPAEPEPLWPEAEKAIPETPAEPEPAEPEPLWPESEKAVPDAPAMPEQPRKRSSRLMGRMGDRSYDYSVAPEESSPSLGSDTARRKPSRMMGKVGRVRYVNSDPAGAAAGAAGPRESGSSYAPASSYGSAFPAYAPTKSRRRRAGPVILAVLASLLLSALLGFALFKVFVPNFDQVVSDRIQSEIVPGSGLPLERQYSNAILKKLRYTVVSSNPISKTAVVEFRYVDVLALADQLEGQVSSREEYYRSCIDLLDGSGYPRASTQITLSFDREGIGEPWHVVESPELADVLSGGTVSAYAALLEGNT